MFEVEKCAVGESSEEELPAPDEFYAAQEQGLHDDVILKMNVCVSGGVLSRMIKGKEK